MATYLGLKKVSTDLPDDISGICASVLNQYIEEDGIVQGDSQNEVVLERLMKFSTDYFLVFLDVIELHKSGGAEAVSNWQYEQREVFYEHAKNYENLYSQIQHMSEAPYFMTTWSMFLLVDTSLLVMGLDDFDKYKEMDKETSDELDYLLRFGENLLQKFQSEAVISG